MEKPAKRVKKVAKKSLMNTSKPNTTKPEKRVPAIPVNVSTDWREEEELVDYESEHQPCFSPHVDDISEPGDSPHTPVPGQADSSSGTVQGRRMMHPWRGRNAAQIPRKTSCGARRLKTNWQPLLGEVVSPSPFSKTISSWQTHRGPLRGKSAHARQRQIGSLF